MFKEMLENVRTRGPLIHNITNYVTVNDCANILLACGGSPIMADDIDEVEEITSICDGLNINIGTLNHRTIPAMLAAGKRANELGHPVVLDPVGAGASALRTETALRLMKEIRFTVIRGNISEIKTLAFKMSGARSVDVDVKTPALATGETRSVDTNAKTLAPRTRGARGVDADVADQITEENLEQVVNFAKAFAGKTDSVIAVTGAIDIVADAENAYCIRNGHRDMSKITGTGCQLSAMTAAYVAANPDNKLTAAAAAVCAMGLCGEIARKRMTDLDGNASYRNYIIDAVCNLTPKALEGGADYEMR